LHADFWKLAGTSPIEAQRLKTPGPSVPPVWPENEPLYSNIINHVQLIGFLGKDPEKRHGNGANFTVLSVATQQSSKDSNDEWHRVVAFNRLG